MTTRLYRFDNIKFLLIVLVVFAHFIETIDSGKLSELYLVIYTFHMPAFIFLTGFFSKFGLKKIIQDFFLPYLVFQTLYQIFNAVVLCRTHDFTLQYTTPYWIMWYLMVSAMYHLILPLIETNSKRNRLLIFASSVVISLAVGYDDTVGYYLSLSRFFNFMPYFIAGHYAKGYFAEDSCSKRELPCVIRAIIILFAVLLTLLLLRVLGVNRMMLYGSFSYYRSSSSPAIKMLLLVIGFAWCMILPLIIPEKKIPAVSAIGANTLPVYLLHGFVVKLVQSSGIFSASSFVGLSLAVLLTLLVIALFGNSPFSRFFSYVFNFRWLDALFFPKRETQ